MRIFFLLAVMFFASPLSAWSQSTLNFPRVLTASERSTTGFAVLNPGADAAAATFTLYATTGAQVSSTTLTVPARGQLARLGSEVFAGAATSGWVQVTSPASGLIGFWLGGDFSAVTDGAASAPSHIDHILPVAGATEVNIANTSDSTIGATIRIFDASGVELAPAVTQTLTSKAAFQGDVATIFPTVNVSQATHVRITCAEAFATTAVLRDYLVAPTWGVVAGVDAGLFLQNLHFPHVVSGDLGGANYVTIVSVTNLSASSQTVTFTFTPAAEASSATTVTVDIPGNGTHRVNLETLFNLSASAFLDGWIEVNGQTGITGFVAYADLVKKGLAIVPTQIQAQTSLMFAHIADLSPWWTGIALLNETSTSANVEVFAMAPDGSLIGGAQNVATATFTLEGGQKTAKLLSELIPATQSRASDGGFVFVRTTNGVPLFGVELFFTRDLAVLSNVTPGSLASGITYTPPAP